MTVAWVDDNTLTALNWPEIWADYTPTTVYGRRAKAQAIPYLPGQETELQCLWDQLTDDLEKVSPQQINQAMRLLENWPDLHDTFSALDGPTAHLAAKHLLALKQFAFRGTQLADTLMENSLVWTDPGLWEQLLAVFGEVRSSSFALNHVADESYRQQAANHAAAVQSLAMATRHRDVEWLERTGQPVRRDGKIVLNLPEQLMLAQGFKQDASLRWVQDTPFESVFELRPTPIMEAAAEELAAREEQLAAVADALLARLTETIRSELALWRQAESDLRELDLRLARVRLTRLWDACVPQFGTPSGHVQLSHGIHPFLAKQLQKRGKRYVPLNFAPEPGVNVVFGSNMGGKTVAMSLFVLSQLCAQYGLPVPARQFVTRLFPVIRFCASAEGDLAAGLSSFGMEMTQLTAAWRDLQACGDGLFCLDEPGRSTNPLEGEALVIGVVRAAGAGAIGRRSVMVLASHFAAVLYEAKVTKFRVRGLRPGWSTASTGPAQVTDSPGSTELAGSTDHEKQARAVLVDVPPAGAVTAGTAGTAVKAGTGVKAGAVRPWVQTDRVGSADPISLMGLDEWMDYQLERIEGEVDFVTEALPVAEWLGLPSEVLIESRYFLQRGRKP